MDNLYLDCYKSDTGLKCVDIPVETLIIYFVYKQLKSSNLKLNFVQKETKENNLSVTISVDSTYDIISTDSLPVLATYCATPLAIINNNLTVVSGLSSVARQIIKSTSTDDETRKLLGFREACLLACNESSVWTKFCEIDMVKALKEFLQKPENYFNANELVVPEDLARFECHLSLPVRIHNVYKVAQDHAKLTNKISKTSAINSSIPKEQLDLEHEFSEGPYMTLADIILYPLLKCFYKTIDTEIFQSHLPLVHKWFENMKGKLNTDINIDFLENYTFYSKDKVVKVLQNDIKKQSLYISDPQRYKPRNRIFTKQPDIMNALDIVKTMNIEINLLEEPYGHEVNFDWSKVPMEANPEGGALPKSRMKRKCEQLENLAKAVMKIAKPSQTIIDFCSGSGHLGILLATKLPQCTIILLENKEISLNRARERVIKLHLENVVLLQCNLDYFTGDFDIGVSLHACGVATDLVIRHCLQRNAAFVCCPCCYGGVHVCHHISYPRSKIFQNSLLTLHDYLVLGHSADQTHDTENVKTKQGIECMNIIDTDRKLQAEELGYEVLVSKMIPLSCTPKNNILVGLPKEKQ